MNWRTLRYGAIDAFKCSWPCHGLPEDLHSISCEFADNGDLVDIEAYDEDGKMFDTHDLDGLALAALIEECRESGDVSN
jgi:hypothetical protein